MKINLPARSGASLLSLVLTFLILPPMSAAELPVVTSVEPQPFASQIKRLLEACDYIGSPLAADDRKSIEAALTAGDSSRAQQLLDRHCLLGVHINPEMRVKVQAGAAKAVLVEQGWRDFLVKVHNESGTTARLKAESPNAQRLHNSPESDVAQRWLDVTMYDRQPMRESLSGLNLEYRIIQLYSRDAGAREAKISFNCGQGTQDIGYRNEVDVLFQCQATRPVTFRVRDENSQPTMAAFVIRDAQGRIYPPQSKRLAPDFSFHPQVYRGDGEYVRLPPGTYQIELSRGPESIPKTSQLVVDGQTSAVQFQTARWIDPARFGWWSGDHHIHAAGCAHYTKPSEGVHAPDMFRHCLGEDLKVGANLTWGPCFDYQKQFFCGTVDKVSQHPYLLRYDVEVSGFGSHESGHLVLLRLKDQIYPGGDSSKHWPKLGLNTLRWAKRQGAVVGPAHSGWGLKVPGKELPTYKLPPFDGIGANEYIADVTHEVPGPDGTLVPAVDFISTVDTPYVWELNIWYHTLNAGFRTRISGETDFPCIYGERVGLGRSYVKLEKLDYDAWCEGVRQGRNYVGDGRSHLIDFRANDVAMGENGSELKLTRPGRVNLRAKVAARLDEKPNPDLSNRPYEQPPYWHIERARVGQSREVPLEVLVNGQPVSKKMIVADGELRDVSFDVDIPRSSWVALRILPSSHSNPIFVLVDGKPIRASRRSVQWCLEAVDRCWKEKEKFLKAEVEEGRRVYEHARTVYRQRLQECDVD
jgi:hypothetical protein